MNYPALIQALDDAILNYTRALYERAGGNITYLFGGCASIVSDPILYDECSKRASKKYTTKHSNQPYKQLPFN